MELQEVHSYFLNDVHNFFDSRVYKNSDRFHRTINAPNDLIGGF
jgi:hypothetical protein